MAAELAAKLRPTQPSQPQPSIGAEAQPTAESLPLDTGAPDSADPCGGRDNQRHPGDLPEAGDPEGRSTVRSREDAVSAAAADLRARGFDAHAEGTDLVVHAGRTVCRVRNIFRPTADARREAEDLLVALVVRALVDSDLDATDGAETESGSNKNQT
jgi:hypothetical protein